MGLCLKTTAGLLLLVQAFHLASLQDSTDSPGRTIDKSYLRALAKETAGNPNTAVAEPQPGSDGIELNNEYSNGTASGSMAVYDQEEERVAGQDKRAKKTSDSVTAVTTAVAPTLPTNVTTNQTGLPDATTSTSAATTVSTNSSQINITETATEFHNSTTTPTTTATSSNSTSHLSTQNSTSFPDNSNHTELQTTTMAPGSNATQEFTTKHTGSTNATESTNTTTSTATTKQQINETVSTSETTQTSPAATTTAAPITPERANKTDKDAASGSSSERGLAAENHKNKRHGAWGAVLGTAVAVVFVGALAYSILKKKHQKGFSHSKLVEDFPSDPVLRLDNGAPLDLNFGLGGSAYYNPGIQRDELQMTSFPGHH